MDRSFKNNADFKMNQQNFKLSDFGIDVKSGHESKTAGQNNHCKARRSAQVSQRYVQVENAAHVRQVSMSPGLASGTNLLQVPYNHRHHSRAGPLVTSGGSQHRNPNPSQLGQLQNAAVADRFRTSSPCNLSGTGSIVQLNSSPSYWKQYGGQESGVNITRGFEKERTRRDGARTPWECEKRSRAPLNRARNNANVAPRDFAVRLSCSVY
ncbi:uncharacterized protein LOC112552499 [Pogonomyrmex barbatus]|uniref:Uncharacterized protein LOC112552499 n=1 Tax=Pogonomyrmex barbatus TaxID=144034 RepID=A0A8N1S4E2_9HYME|nr:uncharacterized protein LOC112552499 [Pogonomyrmex barbatus]